MTSLYKLPEAADYQLTGHNRDRTIIYPNLPLKTAKTDVKKLSKLKILNDQLLS